MQPPSSSKLLEAWERGRGLNLADRAALLMTAAYPDASPELLANLTVGERDRRLIDLRSAVFGSRITSVVVCPACKEKLDLEFSISDIRGRTDPAAATDLSLEHDDFIVRFRLPTSLDVRKVLSHTQEPGDAARILLTRCIHSVTKGGQEVRVDELPPSLSSRIMDAMEAADPQAFVKIAVLCPTCDHSWNQTFDIVSFVWTEIESVAMRLLQEVHILASAYGWSEDQILGMDPRRRNIYLQMITA